MDRASTVIVLVLTAGMALVLARGCAAAAQIPDRDRLDLARCLVSEADAHAADYGPLLAVLDARAQRVGGTMAGVGRRYCAALRSRHPSRRQEMVLALPDGRGSRAYGRAWTAAWEALDAWDRGERPGCSPTHWGGRHDHAPSAWIRVDCGATVNRFFREPAWYNRDADAR